MNDSVEIDAKHKMFKKKIRCNLLKAIPVYLLYFSKKRLKVGQIRHKIIEWIRLLMAYTSSYEKEAT